MKRIKFFAALILAAFVISMTAFAAGETVSTADFSTQSFTVVSGRATISFDLTANTVSSGFIGIAASGTTPTWYDHYGVCMRIRDGGYFDAYTASGYTSKNEIKYEANKTYHVDIDADMTNQVYNVYITVDGKRVALTDNYPFRASASDLGKITIRNDGTYTAGLYKIENVTALKSSGFIEYFALPNYYCENMVMQRERSLSVFGKATGTGEVTATLERGTLRSTAKAKVQNGSFKVELAPLAASLEPYTLTVTMGEQTRVVKNVYIGDVFFLSGQSNMEQTYENVMGQLGNGVTKDNIPTRVVDNRIKQFTVNQSSSSTPTFDVTAKNGFWAPLTADNNKKLSHIGMFFAAERLKADPNVPVGLISAAWGGTAIDGWIRKSDDNKTANYTPTGGNIYNNHVYPFLNYPVKAVLWYQGEADAKAPVMYAEAFPAMIKDWRTQWNDENLPFFFVQLARYGGRDYAPIREAQAKAIELENVGMAVILDTDKGTYNNIHPLGKEEVAHRLFLLDEKYAYGKDVTAEGPIVQSTRVEDGRIIITFRPDTIGGGLVLKNTYGATEDELSEFEVAEANGVYVSAKAQINLDNTVTVYADGVANPMFVRYAYSGVPVNPNLFNSEGLPAAPINTDTRIFSAAAFETRVFDTDGAKVEIAEFTVTPFVNNIDGLISLTDTANTVSNWNNCGITVRFATNGYFEYVDGSVFKTSTIPYSANTTYGMKILVDFTENTYSVMTKINDEWILMCSKAAFRADALGMTNAGRLLVRSGYGVAAGQFAVDGYSLSSPSQNTVYNAKDGTDVYCLAVSPSYRVYAASYSKSILQNVTFANAYSGVSVLKIMDGEEVKTFFWNTNLAPVK